MTKKILFLIIVFISLFLVIVKYTNKSLTIKEDICKNKQNEEAKAVCYFYQALITQDPTLCVKFGGKTHATELCKQHVQSVKEGLSECGDDYSCYSQKGLWMAVAKQDLTICDNIKDVFRKSDCYTKIAQIKQDPSICDKLKSIIPGDSAINDCYHLVKLMAD